MSNKIYIEIEGGMVINAWSRDEDLRVVVIDHDDEDYTDMIPDLLTDDVEETLNQKMGDYLEQQEAYEEDEEDDDE